MLGSKSISEKSDMSLIKEALFDFFQAVIGTCSNSTLEFTTPSTTSRQLISVINTKNCSLSIVLTATDQKPQKSLKR